MKNKSTAVVFPHPQNQQTRSLNQDTANILVVDDNALTRNLTAEMLFLEQYKAIEAESGIAALECLQQFPIDLILLDVLMPFMNGFEVCRRLKQNPTTQNIPIIFMTVADDRSARVQGLEAGGDDFISKPIDRLELIPRLRNWIRHKRLNEDLDRTEQTLFAIARALESRFHSSNPQSDRLLRLTQSFSCYLQLDATAIQDLTAAAHLHDIGTVAIPDAILLKTTPLTTAEKAIVKQHVLIGEKLCQPLRHCRGVLPIIRHHHERWDGSGYPDGLQRHEIPWLAQVFQTLDIYDALTSSRPYKQALDTETALQIIEEEAKRGWRNPDLVQQFCQFLQSYPC
ncbi:MAG: response regulator [Jaaginema sp. PMC 1079.18]|nr:response regulator [Jaaginema sp. PMC 1080.18]MEC4851126.1 response regulator [Jaaginema sp. PMC 1079.18]MEC4868242.1 response regulator [Jaaginema sp. PMC 1078.18]